MSFALLGMAAFFAEQMCCEIDEHIDTNAATWKEKLSHSSREEVLEHFRAEERIASAAKQTAAEPSATPPDIPDRRRDRVQETKADKLTRFTSDVYVLSLLMCMSSTRSLGTFQSPVGRCCRMESANIRLAPDHLALSRATTSCGRMVSPSSETTYLDM